MDEKEESSPNGSDSEACSSSQSTSTVDAEDVESDLEDLEDFFLLHVAKVRSSCEEGPGQSALSQRIMIRSWT